MRTSYMLDDLGQVHLFLKSDFEYRVRGTKYSIPKPVSGRHGDQDVLLLRADQKEYQRAKTHYNRVQGKLQRQAGQTGSGQAENLPLGFEGNTVISSNYGSKRTDLYDGLSLPTIGFGRRNPNANNRRKK
jgi:RNA-binding protein NOB1